MHDYDLLRALRAQDLGRSLEIARTAQRDQAALRRSTLQKLLQALLASPTHHTHALPFFRQLEEAWPGTPDVALYTVVIDGLARRGALPAALALLEEMPARGIPPNAYTYTALIRGYLQQGEEEAAERTYQAMAQQSPPCAPDLVLLSSLISHFAEGRQEERVQYYWAQLQAHGIRPDGVVYSALLKMLARDHARPQPLFALYDEMARDPSIVPNLYILQLLLQRLPSPRDPRLPALLHAMHTHHHQLPRAAWIAPFRRLVQAEDDVGALDLLELLQARGAALEPGDLIAVQQIVQSVAAGDRVLHLMERCQLAPERRTYEALLTSLASRGHMEAALVFLDRMRVGDWAPTTTTYNQLLHLALQAHQPHTAVHLYNEMKAQGLQEDAVTLSTLIRNGITWTQKTSHSQDNHYHNSNSNSLPDEQQHEQQQQQQQQEIDIDGLELAREFVASTSVEKALEVLEKMGHQWQLSVNLYNVCIHSLQRAGDVEGAERVCRHMEGQGVAPDTVTYSTLILGYCTAQQPERALALLQEMEEKGVAPNATTYYCLVRGLYHAHRFPQGQQLLRTIQRQGLLSDGPPLHMVLNGLLQARDYPAVLALCEALGGEGLPTTCAMYTKIAAAMARDRTARDQLPALFERMGQEEGLVVDTRFSHKLLSGLLEEEGGVQQLVPTLTALRAHVAAPVDTYTYNTMVQALCEENMRKEVLALFGQMQSEQVETNAHTYNILIRYLGERGLLAGAEKLFQQMTQAGVTPNADTINHLSTIYCQQGRYDEAVGLVGRMSEFGLQPTGPLGRDLIRTLCGAGEYSLAFRCLDVLLANRVVLGEAAFTSLIQALCETDESEKVELALRVMQRMQQVDMEPDGVIYNILLGALSATSQFDKLLKMLATMRARGVEISPRTFDTIISRLCHSRQVDAALKVFSRLSAYGLQPSIITCNSVINGLVWDNRLEEAEAMMNDLQRAHGLQPNHRTYTSLLRGYSAAKNFDKATALYRRMEQQQVECDARVYHTLILGYCLADRYSDALQYLQVMRSKQLTPEFATLSALVEVLCRARQSRELLSLLQSWKRGELGSLPFSAKNRDMIQQILIRHSRGSGPPISLSSL